MHTHFGIQDNEGGGDCLFAAIRDGLAKDGITVTVEELRGNLQMKQQKTFIKDTNKCI